MLRLPQELVLCRQSPKFLSVCSGGDGRSPIIRGTCSLWGRISWNQSNHGGRLQQSSQKYLETFYFVNRYSKLKFSSMIRATRLLLQNLVMFIRSFQCFHLKTPPEWLMADWHSNIMHIHACCFTVVVYGTEYCSGYWYWHATYIYLCDICPIWVQAPATICDHLVNRWSSVLDCLVMHHMLVIIQALPAWPGSDSVYNACGSALDLHRNKIFGSSSPFIDNTFFW